MSWIYDAHIHLSDPEYKSDIDMILNYMDSISILKQYTKSPATPLQVLLILKNQHFYSAEIFTSLVEPETILKNYIVTTSLTQPGQIWALYQSQCQHLP